MSDTDNIQQKIDDLTNVLLEKLPGQLAEIRRLFEVLREETSPHEDTIENMYIIAHKYAGSAGSFGLDEIGQCFHDLEQSLNNYSGTFPIDMNDDHPRQIMKLIDTTDKAISERLHNI